MAPKLGEFWNQSAEEDIRMTIQAENPYLPVLSTPRIEVVGQGLPQHRWGSLRSGGARIYRANSAPPTDACHTYTAAGTLAFDPLTGRMVDLYA
jgi:hypothetical protein